MQGRHLVSKDSLCRGNGASVLRIVPYAALHFGAYEHYRQVLVEAAAAMSKRSVSTYVVPPSLDLVAGSAAGATAVMVPCLALPAILSILTEPTLRILTCTMVATLYQVPCVNELPIDVGACMQVTYPLDLVRTRLAYGMESSNNSRVESHSQASSSGKSIQVSAPV